MTDLLDKTLSILCIEDKKLTQDMIEAFLQINHPDLKFDKHTTCMGAIRSLRGQPIDSIDLVICDWMLPCWDASYIIKDLYNTGKPVIFYTAISEEDVKAKVRDILGFYPRNFKYVMKSSVNNLTQINSIIENEVC